MKSRLIAVLKSNVINSILAATVASLALSGCGRTMKPARLDTVEVPQTPIKSQYRIGFCWSYGTIGFLETLMIKKTGQTMDFSEEALGFYRMAEELKALSKKFPASELADVDMVSKKVFEGLQGWDMTFNPAYNPGMPVRNSMQLVQDYGVVPESAWSYKFKTDEQIDKFSATVFAGFASLMTQRGQGNITQDMVFDLLASPDAFGSRPPTEFDYTSPAGDTAKISAKDFVSNVIGFTPDDYTYLIPDQTIGYDQIVKATKLTLARGINVPLSYAIYDGAINQWDASHSAKDLDPANLKLDGGHLVLITDFVNKGGRPGAVANDVLQTELAKPSSELDFVVIKNSWDTRPQSPVLRLPGYYTMDQSYISLLSKKQTDITVVVPRDIAFAVRYGN